MMLANAWTLFTFVPSKMICNRSDQNDTRRQGSQSALNGIEQNGKVIQMGVGENKWTQC
jgi:hypothetical protein